jgi:hypothetical protein
MSRSITRLRSLARNCCSPATISRVFDPMLADMTHDLAGASGWRGTARQLKWEMAFLWSLCQIAVPEWRRRDDAAGVKAVTFAAATLAAATVLLVAVVMVQTSYRYPVAARGLEVEAWVRLAWYLLPQAVVALPIALLLTATFHARQDRPVARRTIIALTIMATVATFIMLLWVLPESNQAFRALFFGGRRPPSRGPNEVDLRTLLRALNGDGWLGPTFSTPSIMLAFYSRIAFFATPILYALLGMALRRRFPRRRATVIASITAGAYLLWYIGPDFSDLVAAGHIPAFVAAFVPNALALVGVCGLRLRSVDRSAPGTLA